jgi:hypothetical protein
MRAWLKERPSWAARHDFDSLPTGSDVQVQPASRAELSTLAAMAHRLVPGVQITAPILTEYATFDSECIFTFRRQERLLGGIAFLYLNSRGHDALILDEMSLTCPDRDLLARRDEEVSAVYIWALATVGRGIAGYGKVAAHLRKPRYIDADCFAQPSTKAGRDFLIATCFKQIPSFQRDLWIYERPWNRLPRYMPAFTIPTRSFAHARH